LRRILGMYVKNGDGFWKDQRALDFIDAWNESFSRIYDLLHSYLEKHPEEGKNKGLGLIFEKILSERKIENFFPEKARSEKFFPILAEHNSSIFHNGFDNFLDVFVIYLHRFSRYGSSHIMGSYIPVNDQVCLLARLITETTGTVVPNPSIYGDYIDGYTRNLYIDSLFFDIRRKLGTEGKITGDYISFLKWLKDPVFLGSKIRARISAGSNKRFLSDKCFTLIAHECLRIIHSHTFPENETWFRPDLLKTLLSEPVVSLANSNGLTVAGAMANDPHGLKVLGDPINRHILFLPSYDLDQKKSDSPSTMGENKEKKKELVIHTLATHFGKHDQETFSKLFDPNDKELMNVRDSSGESVHCVLIKEGNGYIPPRETWGEKACDHITNIINGIQLNNPTLADLVFDARYYKWSNVFSPDELFKAVDEGILTDPEQTLGVYASFMGYKEDVKFYKECDENSPYSSSLKTLIRFIRLCAEHNEVANSHDALSIILQKAVKQENYDFFKALVEVPTIWRFKLTTKTKDHEAWKFILAFAKQAPKSKYSDHRLIHNQKARILFSFIDKALKYDDMFPQIIRSLSLKTNQVLWNNYPDVMTSVRELIKKETVKRDLWLPQNSNDNVSETCDFDNLGISI